MFQGERFFIGEAEGRVLQRGSTLIFYRFVPECRDQALSEALGGN